MHIQEQLVGPKLAEMWLQKNLSNRPVRKNWVIELARMMRAGEFKLTHQGIAFDADGFLIDGQHRLLAIIMCGLDVRLMVARTDERYKPVEFPTDRGVTRSVADSLAIPKSVSETCCFLARSVYGNRISLLNAHRAYEVFGPMTIRLLDFCGGSRRVKTSAPVRSAVVLHAIQGNAELILEAYRDFVHLDYSKMPPSLLSLTKQIDGGMVKSTEHLVLFAKAYIAFDVNRFDCQRIVTRDAAAIAAEARQVISQKLGVHP